MVETEIKNYGADKIGQKILLAGCSYSSGRTMVDLLEELDAGNIEPGLIQNDARLRFSIPENRAIIKRIKVDSNENIDKNKMAEFEFSSSILDDISKLYIQTYPLNGDGTYLTFGYHRNQVDTEILYFTEKLIKPSGYELRSWAMVSGYLNYCHRDGGELILLLDISSTGVSYSFVKDTTPILVGTLSGNLSADDESDDSINSFLDDLKATIKYQTGMLFKSGYSTPVSLIVVTGNLSNPDIKGRIEEKMKVRTIVPSIRKSFFVSDLLDRAGLYLVSLGLTVDKS